MGGKTCGTCAYYVPFPLREGKGLCYQSIDDDYQLFVKADDVCYGAGLYRERTDGLEQVAREMYADLRFHDEFSGDDYAREQYEDRLMALGVDLRASRPCGNRGGLE